MKRLRNSKSRRRVLMTFNETRTFSDTDTDNRIFTHKNGLLSGNNFPAQYPNKFHRDPYINQQQGQEDPIYQSQMTRNDWSQLMQQQPQLSPNKHPDAVWPEKLAKQTNSDEKASRKKGKGRENEYSEEYGDESQAETDDATTTETPKKVNILYLQLVE